MDKSRPLAFRVLGSGVTESMDDVEARFLRNPEAVKMVEEAIANIDSAVKVELDD